MIRSRLRSRSGGSGASFTAAPLPTASTANGLFISTTGTFSRLDLTNVAIPAGDWSFGGFIKIPTSTNTGARCLFNAAPSATNPHAANNTLSVIYRREDGQFSVIATDASGNTLGQTTAPLPSANSNSNALVSTYPIELEQSVLFVITKIGNTARMWLCFDGCAPVIAAESYTTMGAVTSAAFIGLAKDSSSQYKGYMRNWFKVSYGLTKAQINQIANGSNPTSFGSNAADDWNFLFDANVATQTSTINGITASRVFNDMTVVTGIGLAAQTEAVYLDPIGADYRVIQQVSGSATIPVTGTYIGTNGVNIQAQFINQNGTAFTGWTTVTTGATGGTWSGSVSVPKGKRWARMQIRKVISGTPSTDVMTTALRFGVGENVILIGQSLMEHMGTVLTTNTYGTGSAAYGSNASTPNGFTTMHVDRSPAITLSNRKQFNVTGMANNGSGLIRVTASGRHGLITGQEVYILGTVGTTESIGRWVVTVIDRTTFDLVGSTFTNAWISGGVVYSWRSSYRLMNNSLDVAPDGHSIIANAISNLSNSVVCISNQAVGGQAIAQFNKFTVANGINAYGATATLAARELGGVGGVLWLHGHQNIGQTTYFMDSGTWGSETGYGELGVLYDFYKTNVNPTHFGVAGFTSIGGTSFATALNTHEFRHAFKRFASRKVADGETSVFFAGFYNDMQPQWENSVTQNAHLSPTLKGYQSQAARLGQALAFRLGAANDAQGAQITSASRSGAVIDLTVTHNGGSLLKVLRTGAMPSGFEVSTSTGFGSLLTISNVQITGTNTIRITLSADPAATCYVRYQWGYVGNYASSTYFTPRITGVADNGSGLIRVTCATTGVTPAGSQKNNTGHGLTTGQWINIEGVAGSTQANGIWQVTVIDATNFDLVGSTSVGLGTFTAGSNLWQASATGVVAVELGVPIYDDRTVGGFDTNGAPLQPTASYVTA